MTSRVELHGIDSALFKPRLASSSLYFIFLITASNHVKRDVPNCMTVLFFPCARINWTDNNRWNKAKAGQAGERYPNILSSRLYFHSYRTSIGCWSSLDRSRSYRSTSSISLAATISRAVGAKVARATYQRVVMLVNGIYLSMFPACTV